MRIFLVQECFTEIIYAHISISICFCLSHNNQKSCLIYIFHVNYFKLEKLTNVHQVKSKGVWRSIPQGIGGLHNHSVLHPDRGVGLAKETGVTSSFVVVRTLAHILLTAHEQNKKFINQVWSKQCSGHFAFIHIFYIFMYKCYRVNQGCGQIIHVITDHCNVTLVASAKKWIIGFSDESVSMYSHFYCTLLSYSMGLSVSHILKFGQFGINQLFCVLSDWWFKTSKEKKKNHLKISYYILIIYSKDNYWKPKW